MNVFKFESSFDKNDYFSLEEDSSSFVNEHCSPQQCSCSTGKDNSKNIKVIQTLNGLQINVLSASHNYILDLIHKIADPKERERNSKLS